MTESTMTRDDLIVEAVEAMVAKWGEAERAGCERTVAAKSTATLRADRAMRLGEPLPRGRQVRAARGNFDRGAS